MQEARGTEEIPHFILILGSYDPETRSLLYEIKEFIAERFQEEVYGLILDETEVYACEREGEGYIVMVDRDRPTAYIIHMGKVVDVIPLGGEPGDICASEARLRELLEERYGMAIKRRLPVLEKIEALAKPSSLIFIVRHRQLTRCGEYVELTFLLERGVEPSRITFLWNSDVELSSMVKELLDLYNFTFRPYSSREDLKEEVYRLIYYRITRPPGKT